MMKIIVPLSIEAVTAQLRRPNQACVVQGAFRNDTHPAVQTGCTLVYRLAEFFQNIQSGVIENGVNRIEAKRVDVIVGNPLQSVGDEEVPDLVAIGVVEVERMSPWR